MRGAVKNRRATSRERFTEFSRHRRRQLHATISGQSHAHSDLLQQQLPRRAKRIPDEDSGSFAQPFDLYRALQLGGYRNIYELAPLLDIKTSKLEFESSPL